MSVISRSKPQSFGWFSLIIITLLAASLGGPPVRLLRAASLDAIADAVLGQPDFASNAMNNGGVSANSLNTPWNLVVDRNSGRIYVADTWNHRVLSWPNAASFANGQAADLVIGQPNFTSDTANNGGISATSLGAPMGVAVDSSGNLYVADAGNNRILAFTAPITSNMAASRVFGQPNFTSNIANNGGSGPASLHRPIGIAIDSNGNLYVADNQNNRVLEYNTVFSSDTVADRVFGWPDFNGNAPNNGTVNATSLLEPVGVAVDADGNLYISDEVNNRVLEYDAPTLYDTIPDRVFGQPDFSSNTGNNGGVSAATLSTPGGIAVDANGNLYIADQNNHRVIEYDTPLISDTIADRVFGQPDLITNAAASSGVSATNLAAAAGVAVDGSGNLYIADTHNHRVLRFDTPVPGATLAITSLNPSAVAAASRSFVLTIRGTSFISGTIVRWNGTARPTTFINSSHLTAEIAAADVAEPGAVSITVVTPGGDTSAARTIDIYTPAPRDTIADRVLGQPSLQSQTINYGGTGATGFVEPYSMAIDRNSGRLYVVDVTSHRVLSWPNISEMVNGQAADLALGQSDVTMRAANRGAATSAAALNTPLGVAVDDSGNVYIADWGNNRVLGYQSPIEHGQAADMVIGQPDFISNTANNGGISTSSLNGPRAVATDEQGNLYIADTNNHRVLEYNMPFASDTTADNVFGQPNFASNSANNGGIGASSLNNPESLAVDRAGNLYVADGNNYRVLVYDTPLTANTIADRVLGQPDFASGTAENGQPSASRFSPFSDNGLAVDDDGNLYVSDEGNHRVLAFTAPITSNMAAGYIFGQPDFVSKIPNNGGVSATSLRGAVGVAVDSSSNLYVGDVFNYRVLRYDSPLQNPRPLITSLTPTTIISGSGVFTITISGANFVDGAVVRWNGADLPTTFVSSLRLTAQLNTANISVGRSSVIVVNPPPGGGASSPVDVPINETYSVYLPFILRP